MLEAVAADQSSLIWKDPAMERVVQLAGQIARSDAPVLVTGESGTGKEVIARHLHQKSLRKDKPFVAVNCAAIPDNLLESELFGHEKGAFTGAIARRIGKFEEANGGTLLLDEISEMDVRLQAKLLRALQERMIDRSGERRRSRSTCASSPPPTAISAMRYAKAPSAKTCSTASTWCICGCRRCASGLATSSPWRIISLGNMPS